MKYHVRNIKHSAWHEKACYENDLPVFSYISASHINPVKKKVTKKYLLSSYSPEELRGNSRLYLFSTLEKEVWS